MGFGIMAHYAFLDANNVVTEIIVGVEENEIIDGLTPEEYYSELKQQRCLRTSYNGNIRVRYAVIGGSYDDEKDAFINIQPYPSWILDEVTTEWVAPVTKPNDGKDYVWNEASQSWLAKNEPLSIEIIKKRVDTCYECPLYNFENNTCVKCGCGASYLHTDPKAVCPEGKW